MDFDLEPGNVHMEIAADPNVRGQEDDEEEEEEDEVEAMNEQDVTSTDPPD
jgi:hypothetical protein